MPTSSQLDTARNSLLANLQSLRSTNPIAADTIALALLSLIADNIGSSNSGGGTVSGAVAIQDGTTSANKLAVNASGQIGISNLPTTQAISGTVSISNFPSTQPVSIATLPSLAAGTNAIGSVTVSNLPATQSVSVGLNTDTAPLTETVLTAAGSTTARSVSGYRYYSYHIQVSGIGTNVVLRMEGTHLTSPAASADWYSLQGNNIDTTITANGSYKFQIAGETDFQVRMTLVSFSGGTPSVTCTLIRGN